MPALTHQPALHRYVMTFDGGEVYADYRLDGHHLHIPHVEADPALRGTGAASIFMRALVEEARAKDLKIIPICSYAATWLKRHEDCWDVLG